MNSYNFQKRKKDIRKEVFSKYGGMCAYCGTQLNPERFELDHIIPRQLCNEFLKYSVDNLNPCCIMCNRAKNNKSIEEFRQHIQKKIDKLKGQHGFHIIDRLGLLKQIKPVEFYYEKAKKVKLYEVAQ